MTSPAPFIVRPLASTKEYTAYYRLANAAFSSQPSEEDAQRWQRETMQSPDFQVERVRGAFRVGQQLGGYTLHDRVLRMGAARISVGCIGAVVTFPEARKQGVASALMRDALDFARKNGHALLLLDGIPNFYYRYGYIDMFDSSAVEVDRSAILAQPSSGHHVRLATVDDAPAILALYQRHFGGYTGSFERSLELQAFRLLHRGMPLVIALSAQGDAEGYLLYGMDDKVAQGREVAADNWDALLALLHYHARLFDGSAAPATLQYVLPLGDPAIHQMIDTLEVPDTSQWQSPAEEWSVRGLSYHHRFAGWMACLIDFPLLMNSILPELQARWQRSLAHWAGEILFAVDGQTRVLRFDGGGVQLADSPGSAHEQLELTPQAMVQLVFGYHPLSRLADISHLSNDARSALAILFPSGHTWIPRTDWF